MKMKYVALRELKLILIHSQRYYCFVFAPFHDLDENLSLSFYFFLLGLWIRMGLFLCLIHS